ncbi:hypothetical protein KIK06_07410 [Nocardiopsis sp. EMB25]|uniref:hypothetical protein n=1 Tax=Nocardiopsis sp. EMB25 TaxID=2835867 RepID=UPI002283F31F|nr:hypothetical protein [Nocardiopsis sp. EMB25]MCY9783718.1 hypothetical protein [Nocardiopsis sp. EMB25]
MPTIEHEFLVELFQNAPDLAPRLVSHVFGIQVPSYAAARLECGNLNDVLPTEYTADSVITLRDPARVRTLGKRRSDATAAIIVEIQQGKDQGKLLSWPVYLTTLRARLLGAPTYLVTLCPDRAVAAWASQPIPMGHPGYDLQPLVIGPDEAPVVADPVEIGRSPELGVLSALVHSAARPELVDGLMEGLSKIDPDRAANYTQFVMALLDGAAKERMEAIVASAIYEFSTPFTEQYVAKGRAEGEAAAILEVLDERGIAVGDEVRERVTACTDQEQLQAWVRRAVRVETAEELFD